MKDIIVPSQDHLLLKMDAGVYCADDIDDADDNGRESVVWRLPGFYSHFPSPGRAPNYPPYWGWRGIQGVRWDTGGRGIQGVRCRQIPAFLDALQVGYGGVDQVTPFIRSVVGSPFLIVIPF